MLRSLLARARWRTRGLQCRDAAVTLLQRRGVNKLGLGEHSLGYASSLERVPSYLALLDV